MSTEAIREQMHETLLIAKEDPSLYIEWRMAEAALGHPDAIRLLHEALEHTKTNADSKVSIYEQLAAVCASGGDNRSARRYLHSALDIAQDTAHAAVGRLSCRLACHLLSSGLPEEAEPLLWRALESAEGAREVALCSMVAALMLSRGQWHEAQAMGVRITKCAADRGNWLGVADGLITQATALVKRGDIEEAIGLLVHGGHHLRRVGSRSSLNLIKVKLLEIRRTHNDSEFDELLKKANQTGDWPMA